MREHRTALDWAEEIKYLVDTMYPNVEKIILIMDNLNTHKVASLYKRYPAAEAHRIMKKLEIHYTPKHGSWLDMAEIELNVMTRQCLSRRIDNIDLLERSYQHGKQNAIRSSLKSGGILEPVTHVKSLYHFIRLLLKSRCNNLGILLY